MFLNVIYLLTWVNLQRKRGRHGNQDGFQAGGRTEKMDVYERGWEARPFSVSIKVQPLVEGGVHFLWEDNKLRTDQ